MSPGPEPNRPDAVVFLSQLSDSWMTVDGPDSRHRPTFGSHPAMICPTSRAARILSISGRKNISVFRNVESGLWSSRPASVRGADASSRTRGGMRWTRGWCETSIVGADGEIVWSWPPDAEVKLRGYEPRDDGGKKARSPGRSRISRNPSRRECRMIRLNLWFLPRAFSLHGGHG